MMGEDSGPLYRVWGADHAVYGPVELPELVHWVKDERIVADTWIYADETGAWKRAAELPELTMFFSKANHQSNGVLKAGEIEVKPAAMRRIRALAELTDEQLERFLGYMELVKIRAFTQVSHRGQSDDAMYLVLEGELRSALNVDGKEVQLGLLLPGSVFGEISVLDHGPHAADVISNQESLLVKISAESLERISREAPDAALPFLLALLRSVAARVRLLTKKFETSVQVTKQTSPLAHTLEELKAAEPSLQR